MGAVGLSVSITGRPVIIDHVSPPPVVADPAPHDACDFIALVVTTASGFHYLVTCEEESWWMIGDVSRDKRGVLLQAGLARIDRPEPWPPVIGRSLVFRAHSEVIRRDVVVSQHHVDQRTSVVVRATPARIRSLRSICGSAVMFDLVCCSGGRPGYAHRG